LISPTKLNQEKANMQIETNARTVIVLTKMENAPLEVVPHVELNRYLGKWFEIARLPANFQDGCNQTTATYTLNDDGSVSVLNECVKNGKLKRAKGKAKIVDKITGSKLKVTFFWPFYGDYWIINLGKNYDYSVVGTPDRKYLWVLSRTPQMDDKLFSQLMEFAKSKGFETQKLIISSHSNQK
jgi:apolipoprotein D and lipocalin family protein